MREGRFDGQGGVEVCQEAATVREFLGPKPEMRRVETAVAPALPPEKDPGGGCNALLEETDVGQSIGKGAWFGQFGWSFHAEECRRIQV